MIRRKNIRENIKIKNNTKKIKRIEKVLHKKRGEWRIALEGSHLGNHEA